MGKILKFSTIFILTLFTSYINNEIPDEILSTLYNLDGIVFAIGMGLIVSFSLEGVKNENYIRHIRKTLVSVRASFLYTFALLTVFYIIWRWLPKYHMPYVPSFIHLNWSYGLGISLVSGGCFFVHNFICIQTLKEKIFDTILNEENKTLNP